MKSITTCYSENAIKISNSYCSGPSNQAYLSPNLIPSIQNAVTCIYKVKLSAEKHFFIKITWCSLVGQGFSMSIADDLRSLSKFSRNSRQFKKLKGTKTIECCNSRIEVFWDLSQATYDIGPEPVSGYYLMIWINSQLSLHLGEMEEEEEELLDLTKRMSDMQFAKFSLLSRGENFSGNALYSTKAKFCDAGTCHDIVIKCVGEETGSKDSELCVSIDKKNVIQVKRLQWNFRGNQTIFVDGLLVDMMWDVHDWYFNPSAAGYAVFLFRTRSGLDSRLWLEEKMLEQQKEHEKVGFSLLICACKTSH
ncbi:hypothetical protein ACH5RR_004613 [Cinchona calisaya]|uniref:Uncharacterized protein n=1 Tax=Cinchona calisaya TaxID=153742 RepID=A0ABD3AY18_9GENT